MADLPEMTPEEEKFWNSMAKPIDLPTDWIARTNGGTITADSMRVPDWMSNKRRVDAVNPSHYKRGEIECIDALRAALTDEEFRGYCKGSAIAYLWRDGQKDNPKQEASKAGWYVEWLKGKDPRK